MTECLMSFKVGTIFCLSIFISRNLMSVEKDYYYSSLMSKRSKQSNFLILTCNGTTKTNVLENPLQ